MRPPGSCGRAFDAPHAEAVALHARTPALKPRGRAHTAPSPALPMRSRAYGVDVERSQTTSTNAPHLVRAGAA